MSVEIFESRFLHVRLSLHSNVKDLVDFGCVWEYCRSVHCVDVDFFLDSLNGCIELLGLD